MPVTFVAGSMADEVEKILEKLMGKPRTRQRFARWIFGR